MYLYNVKDCEETKRSLNSIVPNIVKKKFIITFIESLDSVPLSEVNLWTTVGFTLDLGTKDCFPLTIVFSDSLCKSKEICGDLAGVMFFSRA